MHTRIHAYMHTCIHVYMHTRQPRERTPRAYAPKWDGIRSRATCILRRMLRLTFFVHPVTGRRAFVTNYASCSKHTADLMNFRAHGDRSQSLRHKLCELLTAHSRSNARQHLSAGADHSMEPITAGTDHSMEPITAPAHRETLYAHHSAARRCLTCSGTDASAACMWLRPIARKSSATSSTVKEKTWAYKESHSKAAS